VRHSQLARRAGVPVAAALFGALAATPALADVTVSPATAPQGSGQDVTLRVTNDGDRPVHTIKLTFPDDTPLAEAYPLSQDDWAPRIETRTLSTPLATLHGNVPTTQTAASITWLAMPGHDLAPGRSAQMTVSVGPMPALSSMRLTVSTTYADGKAGPVLPPAVIALTPDTTGGQTGHGHGGTATEGAGTAADEAENAYFEQAVADADRGPSVWSIAGWVVAALALIGGAVMVLRSRHRAEDDEPDEEEITAVEPGDEPTAEKEPVSAGSGKWAYKG